MNQDQTFAVIVFLLASVVFGVLRIAKGPIGQALARRLSGHLEPAGRDDEIDALKGRLVELEERLDFTERLLLQQQERGQIPAGGHGP